MQAKTHDFISSHRLQIPPELRYIDLASEVGELGKALLLAGGYGKRAAAATPDIAGEAGDCLFSLLALCDSLGIDAQAALDAALEKYARRYAAGDGIGSQPE